MKPIRIALCLWALSVLPPAANASDFWNIGPMVHYQFGALNQGWTFGIEASYWWEEPEPAWPWNAPVSLDAGIEFSRNKVRIYTEGQTGFLVAGLSAGPYLEFPYLGGDREGPALQAGLQYGLWGWWLAGLNLRCRWSPEETYFSPGLFAKVVECGGNCTGL